MVRVWTLALVATAACGGSEPAVSRSQARARVQVVRCAPAAAAPMIASDDLDLRDVAIVRSSPRPRRPRRPSEPVARPGRRPERGSLVILRTPTLSSGTIELAVVMRVMRAALPRLGACFERHLATHPAAVGAVRAAFTIGRRGQVSDVTTSGTSGLSACVSPVISRLRFPSPSRAPVRVLYPIEFSAGPPALDPKPGDRATTPWTPFAIEGGEPLDTAPVIARLVEVGVRDRLPAIEACFARSATTGSLRAMVAVDPDGVVGGARVGGLGDAAVEACVGRALGDLHVVPPSADAAEVACDLSRGDAQPWRIAVDGGYDVIYASRTQLTHGTETLAIGAEPPPPLPGGQSYLIVADPDTPGLVLEHALAWAYDGDGTLVALRMPAGAPRLLGIGRSQQVVGFEEPDRRALRVALRLTPKTLAACVHRAAQEAVLSDSRAVSAMVGRVSTKCHRERCVESLPLAIEAKARVGELLEVMATVRHHGFDHVVLGGEPRCAPMNMRPRAGVH